MSAQNHSKKTLLLPNIFQFQRKQGKTKGAEVKFCILPWLTLWIIISVINFPSSPTILIGHCPRTLWPRSTEVTNVFPWKQTCHAIVKDGLSNEIQLCQRGTSWWPDWSHISTTVILLTTKLLLNCMWALAVIVRHMHVLLSLSLCLCLYFVISLFCLPPMVCLLQRLSMSQSDDTGQLIYSCIQRRKMFSILFSQKGREIILLAWLKKLRSSQWSERSETRLWHADKSFLGTVWPQWRKKSYFLTSELLYCHRY